MLHLLDKHFGRNHKYRMIFNRNNVKISYSCMNNMKYIISSTAWWPNMAFFSGPYFFPFFSIWIFFHEHSDWLWENTDQKKLRIWALFIPCSHKKKVTNTYNVRNCKTYISRNKSNCPLDNKCLTDKIVYKADVETNNGINELSTKVYFGISVT